MNESNEVSYNSHRKWNRLITATIFIIVGVLFLGRNLGWVDPDVFHYIVSWQMLLIVIGVVQLTRRNFVGGLVLVSVGGFFLIPSEYGIGDYWPVIFIIIGIGILLKFTHPHSHPRWHHRRSLKSAETNDGFVEADVSFGSSRHIALDPVFRGADLDISFGNIALDLRKTQLEQEETYIDIDCSFGGIELFIPSTWNVLIQVDNSFGGVNDKRHFVHAIDYDHKLIIRGEISFGGLEIKS
ncbi:putative membrane protein [Parabacteroides sp. PFB2-10]|uniref:LiaF transmembrane domain-containing protein n=1 Tax=Parabacteroides sp. PFB2-10 TaxID=1742405 RepID=UPI002475250F|nr:DUF5668 domain-containing protein [Parabacteroides sp. PFB2-10]MDH6313323.1 putative membrane protein [Parabacteroides sp. PFB2-10]